ncbi:unnamed protein product [Rhizophagus irregularis]|nr:unnamed protein product [Rhizophagus irregularis]
MAVKKTTKQVKKTTKRTKRQTVKRERVKQVAKRSRVNLVAKRSQLLRKKPSATKHTRHFQLNGSMVGRWIKASENWTTEIRRHTIKVISSGRKAFYPEAEKKLYTWIIEQRKQGLAVTYTTVKVAIFEILKEPEMTALYGNATENFKASFRWLTSFMKRYKLSLRRRTKISQKLLRQTEELLEQFQQFITSLRIKKSFEFYGTKLPPICIFKGKRVPRGEEIPDGVFVWFQDSGWMDTNIMKNYVKYLVDEINEPDLLKMMVYDSFKGHLEESVKESFVKMAINKPFKDNLRKEWHLWMASSGARETKKENLRRAKISEVCGWVKRAWDNISDEIIIESFKKCGISNSLNELEDGDIDENVDEENEEFLIEMHENLDNTARLQARYETITLEDDSFFEIELKISMCNSEFIDFNENDFYDD